MPPLLIRSRNSVTNTGEDEGEPGTTSRRLSLPSNIGDSDLKLDGKGGWVSSGEPKPVGMEHIVALGDASASLGLISTLVFSIGIERIFEFELTGQISNAV
eukprot:915216-Prymnesium_polylepis.2